jgi:hypothetical protein
MGIRVVQVNLHRSISASTVLCERMAREATDIALVQEPWTNNDKIRGLSLQGYDTFSYSGNNRPRACVVVRCGLNAIMLPEYSGKDWVTIKVPGGAQDLSYRPPTFPLKRCSLSLLRR